MSIAKVLVIGVAVTACGDGGGDREWAPNSVHGVIAPDKRLPSALVAPEQIDPADIRVALAWFAADPDPSHRPWVTQDVEIKHMSNTWPPDFELAITEPPPAGAVHYELGYSQAKFVAYRDNDGNGQLDWTPADATQFNDEIIAYHPQLYLWFYDDGGLKLMLPGSSEPSDPATPITLLERSDLRSSCHLLEWTPRFAFEAQRHSYPNPEEGDQGPWDHQAFPRCLSNVPPDGARVACQPDFGSPIPVHQYQYYTSWTTTPSSFVADTCGPVMHFCEGYRPDPSVGGDWPCPCDPAKYTCVDYQRDI